MYKLSRNCLRKLFVQTVFTWVGGFLGGSSLHESRQNLGMPKPLAISNPTFVAHYRVRKKRVFWKRGLFRKVHFLEILENLEILEILENPCGKQRRIRPFSRDSREFRDFRDSRDFSSEKTSFVMTPLSVPDIKPR